MEREPRDTVGRQEGETVEQTGLPRDYFPEELPVRAYEGLMLLYAAGFGAFLFAMDRSGRPLPRRIPLRDIALLGVATHRLSRLLSRERVTIPLRAPFTLYKGRGSGPNEVDEQARGHGIRRAVGQLLTCPWCTGMWVATGFIYCRAIWPRPTRLFASILAVDAVSDFFHLAYGITKHRL